MIQFRLKSSLIAAVALALSGAVATPALAQEESTVKATHGAWEVRCKGETCSMTQTFKDGEGRPVLVWSLSKVKEPKDTDKGKAVALSRIVTPLNVLLPSKLGMRIDGGSVRHTDFMLCTPIGCEARPQILEAQIGEFSSGTKVEFLTAVPTAEGPKVIVVDLSLTGFSDAFGDI